MDKVQHFEIPVDDLARARGFYETVFGWKTSDFRMSDGSTYVGLQTGPTDDKNMLEERGFINGGMFKRGGKIPANNPVVMMIVDDIDASLQKAETNGGSIVLGKQDIPDMGYYAYVKDTEGNTVGLFQEIKKA